MTTKEDLLKEGLLRRMEDFSSWYFSTGWNKDIWAKILECAEKGTGFEEPGYIYVRRDIVAKAHACLEASKVVGGHYDGQKRFRRD